eukprot:366468-Chlamydomonas_euryale.AAC.3
MLNGISMGIDMGWLPAAIPRSANIPDSEAQNSHGMLRQSAPGTVCCKAMPCCLSAQLSSGQRGYKKGARSGWPCTGVATRA